ncbi:MAG: PAS domain-containing protein [Oleiphilaceae bacterium]
MQKILVKGFNLAMLIPTKFLDMLPLPILVVEKTEQSLNHPVVYLNLNFSKIIGWNLDEIPDKEHWWRTAYPDPQYQKVVERLWEISIESKNLDNDNLVLMTVNIMTKNNGIKRFKVYTEMESALLDGYYVVAFEEIIELS